MCFSFLFIETTNHLLEELRTLKLENKALPNELSRLKSHNNKDNKDRNMKVSLNEFSIKKTSLTEMSN
jgi:hypothetical protein